MYLVLTHYGFLNLMTVIQCTLVLQKPKTVLDSRRFFIGILQNKLINFSDFSGYNYKN